MIDVYVKIVSYTEPVSMLVDEHPIVNDKDYVAVVTTAPRINYQWDGVDCHITGDKTDDYNILKDKVVNQVLFDKFYEDYQDKKFTDIGLAPVDVYDVFEEDYFQIDKLDNYINNCRFDDNYGDTIQLLIGKASKIYNIILEEDL